MTSVSVKDVVRWQPPPLPPHLAIDIKTGRCLGFGFCTVLAIDGDTAQIALGYDQNGQLKSGWVKVAELTKEDQSDDLR
jgi:hypothetical protein